jgi:23S rRNA pseudouridine955/2504/2580 synthase
VLLVARTAPAAAELSRALASRDAVKIYWALVKGVPKQKRGVVKAALAKEGERGHGEGMTLVDEDEDGAKFALTEYAVLGEAGGEFAWVAAKPLTGRTHQIRVHLASLGTPIVGDFKYGGADAKGKGAVADRLHLHARSIDVPRPDGGRLKVVAPLPPHMRKSWELLGFDPDFSGNPFKRTARGRPKPK